MKTAYTIRYKGVADVQRSTRRTMEIHLSREEAAWRPFLAWLAAEKGDLTLQSPRRNWSGRELSEAFATIGDALEEPERFGLATFDGFRRTAAPPPPSVTVEGGLVLGLHAAGRWGDALAVYCRFMATELNAAVRLQGGGADGSQLLLRGEALLSAGYAAAALPVGRLTSAGLRSARADADDLLTSLDAQVGDAALINAAHEDGLAALRGGIASGAVRLKDLAVRAERRRGVRHRSWRAAIEGELAERFREAESRLEAPDRLARSQQAARDKAFEDLKALFHAQLRLRAPVALWQQRSELHLLRARAAQRLFWLAALLAVVLGTAVPYLLGDYIAGSFHTIRCGSEAAGACVREFSPKGPLTIGGVLLTTSLVLWATRLQYRIFLSERHLCLDAEEKKAFAETFMALKEDASVDVANETIVLASLFRPTQDGIIRDEPGGLDLSAAAVIAKQLAR